MNNTDEDVGTTMRLISASRTDVGRQREQNEDACFDKVVSSEHGVSGLFIVADGMGGYKAGEIASQIAVETLTRDLLPLLGPISGQTTIPLPQSAKHGKSKSGRTRASRCAIGWNGCGKSCRRSTPAVWRSTR